MATVKIKDNNDDVKMTKDVKKDDSSSCKHECKCSKKEEFCCGDSEFVAPVFTDEYGRININKKFAKEFPDLTQKLLDNEISHSKIRPQVFTTNYSKPQSCRRPSNDFIDELISILR